MRAKIDTPYLSWSLLSDPPALTGRVLEVLASWSFHSAAPLRWIRLYQRISASDIRFRSKFFFLLNRSQLLACRIFLSGCLGTVYKTVFSAWLPGWAVRSDWLRVLCSANVTLPHSRSSLLFFLYLRLHAVQLIPLGCQSLLNQHENHVLFSQIRPVINHTTTISQARNGMAWQWQVASVDQSHSPKFGCYSKPPNMRGRGLLMCWLWTTVKNYRLFRYSSISLKYHRYPIDHTIYLSYWADLYVIPCIFPWEMTGTTLYMKSPFPLTARKLEVAISKKNSIWAALLPGSSLMRHQPRPTAHISSFSSGNHPSSTWGGFH